ncbi:MAG TPA: hypothetical protein VGI84_02870 [Pseudonocardiaceae bacterium]
MQPWITRALAMTVVHTVAQTVVVAVRWAHPEWSVAIRSVALAVLVAVAMLWGAIDGWRRADGTTRTWCIAALVTGPAAGVLGLVAQAALVDATGPEELGGALAGGAFTALLVLVPALVGVAVGQRVEAPAPR